jgi:hypothetical protein
MLGGPEFCGVRFGWAKEQSDVPTAVPMIGGHALLCPPYIFVPGVGWVKERSDVPTAVPMIGGHALLCPPYNFCTRCRVGKGAERRAHRGANDWWARFALPTLHFLYMV